MFEKLNSIESEKSLLGALINNPVKIGDLNGLRAEHFYNSSHRKIFSVIQEIISKGKTPDIVTVCDYLRESEQIKDVGGAYYITELVEDSFTSANIKQNEDRIIDFWKRRRIWSEIKKAEQDIPIKDSGEIQNNILESLQKLEDSREYSFQHVSKYVNEFRGNLKNVYENKEPQGIPTGFYEFDKLTGGLKPSYFILVGARPSHGKTALALSIIQNIVKRNIPVGIVSLEMSGEQNTGRLAFSLSRVNSEVVNTGEISDSEFEKMIEAADKIKKYPLYIDEGGTGYSIEIISKASLLRRTHGIKVLFIDYLQLMKGEKAENRNLEIGSISRSLKLFAKKERIPVVALCQLSRQAEGKNPILADLRDSGTLEQDADIVLFIFRPEQSGIPMLEDGKPSENIAILKVAKNRNGATGTFKLTFLKEFSTFENYSNNKR